MVLKTMHTVIFNSNGGSPIDSQYIYSGDFIVKPTAPEKKGFLISQVGYQILIKLRFGPLITIK